MVWADIQERTERERQRLGQIQNHKGSQLKRGKMENASEMTPRKQKDN